MGSAARAVFWFPPFEDIALIPASLPGSVVKYGQKFGAVMRETLCRVCEFFQDDNGHYSMTRLLCFLSFWPASWVVVVNPGEASLGWYLGAYVLGYAGGKAVDVAALKVRGRKVRGEDDSDS